MNINLQRMVWKELKLHDLRIRIHSHLEIYFESAKIQTNWFSHKKTTAASVKGAINFNGSYTIDNIGIERGQTNILS